MRKRKNGTLKSGRSGKTVKSRKQALAIALSEARRAGGKVPKRKKPAGIKRATAKKRPAARKAATQRMPAKTSRKIATKRAPRKAPRKAAAKRSTRKPTTKAAGKGTGGKATTSRRRASAPKKRPARRSR